MLRLGGWVKDGLHGAALLSAFSESLLGFHPPHWGVVALPKALGSSWLLSKSMEAVDQDGGAEHFLSPGRFAYWAHTGLSFSC